MDVFVNDVAAFLPNESVDNDAIESVIGRLDAVSAKTRRIVLKSNQIKTRYYAVDPATGAMTHTNAGLTAEAIRRLTPGGPLRPDRIDCLACGTSTPDLLLPGHALMVQGELGLGPCDAVTTAGICIAGMTAFKHAFLSVASGSAESAVATGSELASSFIRSAFMGPLVRRDREGDPVEALEKRPIQAFDADFLRWMLSDGAGAAFLSREKNPGGPSLRVDWIENISFAGGLDTCMYCGGVKKPDGSMTGWRDAERIDETEKPYLFSIRQDIRLLDARIVSTMGEALSSVIRKHELTPETVRWFLPHYSSAYFRPRFYDEMKRIGFEIPEERWFTNLSSKGNTGSAAIYIILEELFHSGTLVPGDRLLCFIPESGRFSHCFMMLTVV